jgi:hypothetical protein
MSQSRTRLSGMDVHQETIAMAYVAPDSGAEVTDRGPRGTRQGDIAQLVRTRPSKATPLSFIAEAGPWGYGLER